MGIPIESVPYYDNGGGLDLKSSPTKVAEDSASSALNIDLTTDGAFRTRNGSRIVNILNEVPQQIPGAPRGLLMFDYKRADGLEIQISAAGTDLYHGLQSPVAQGFAFDPSLPFPDMEFFVTPSEELMIWGNGVDTNLKFNGNGYSNLSIVSPTNAPVVADNGAGALPAGDFRYTYSFARLNIGVVVQESPTAPIGEILGQPINRQLQLTGLDVSADPQVTHKIIYRESPTSGGVYFRHIAGIIPNAQTIFDDNEPQDGTIEADFDNENAPTSAIFEEYEDRMYYVDSARPTDVRFSNVGKPDNVPLNNLLIFDGPVQCIARCYGTLIFGTDKSLWVLNGNPFINEPRRISSKIGIINNRCAVGETYLYIFATNRKIYRLTPTDFSQDEMRIDDPLSTKVDPFIVSIGISDLQNINMEDYTKSDVAKIMISVPLNGVNNRHILVFNETQSISKGKPVWQIWDNLSAAAMKEMTVFGQIGLYIFDFNGFIWLIDLENNFGDGAEINGTATAGTLTTLTDNTQTWIPNQFVGMVVRIVGGTGENQFRTIISNTPTQLTISTGATDWQVEPDNTSEYTIGGYDVYNYTNWKYVLGNYDILKQLWHLFINANADGDYIIELSIQFDFITVDDQTIFLDFNLKANNSIWAQFIWGQALWGGQAVFQDRLRIFGRFRAIRIGFRHRLAGQPFQINGISLGCQNKGLFYGAE